MSEKQDSYEYMRELAEIPMSRSGILCLCVWTITAWKPETGEIVYKNENNNVLTKLGKATMLSLLFGLSLGSSMVALAAGSGSTPATSSDTRLQTELIGNAQRIPLGNVTSIVGGFVPLSNSDIMDDPVTIAGINYEKSLVCRGIFPSIDGNNGGSMQEFALANTLTLPGSPTAQSGWIYNHFVLPSPISKVLGIEVDADTKIYF